MYIIYMFHNMKIDDKIRQYLYIIFDKYENDETYNIFSNNYFNSRFSIGVNKKMPGKGVYYEYFKYNKIFDFIYKMLNNNSDMEFSKLIIYSLLLIGKLVDTSFIITKKNYKNVFVTALLISNKILYDVPYCNEAFCINLNILPARLNEMELLFLKMLDWNCEIDVNMYNEFIK
jgi:hypothetical protein